MDILRLLDELKTMVLEEPKHFAGMTMGLNRDEIALQINQIRACLPTELKQANSNVKESERVLETAKEEADGTREAARRDAEKIVSEAKAEADRMLERARIDQERMVAESEITKLSKAQAEEIRNLVDREAKEMRGGAERYAYDVLSQLETVLGKAMATVEKGKQEVRPVNGQALAQPRERVR